jgi:hypothetical protein
MDVFQEWGFSRSRPENRRTHGEIQGQVLAVTHEQGLEYMPRVLAEAFEVRPTETRNALMGREPSRTAHSDARRASSKASPSALSFRTSRY